MAQWGKNWNKGISTNAESHWVIGEISGKGYMFRFESLADLQANFGRLAVDNAEYVGNVREWEVYGIIRAKGWKRDGVYTDLAMETVQQRFFK